MSPAHCFQTLLLSLYLFDQKELEISWNEITTHIHETQFRQ